MAQMRFRLALDLGSTSLGWAMVRLDDEDAPCAVIKAGTRIFSDGRNPKDGSSLAVTRRNARSMRRRRDRLLKRKARLMNALVAHGFFPADETARKKLEAVDPFALRAKGLDQALTPAEFARALFHLNQRRGFKSNRRTDKKDNDSGALKTAISQLRTTLAAEGCRTVGEWLHKRHASGHTVRARYRVTRLEREDGKTRLDKRYDLYIDRAMIEAEFDALWAAQGRLDPDRFNEAARRELRGILLFQRPLRPVQPGRCTFLPDEKRAALALPSTQRFRILQEVNHLRILRPGQPDLALTREQRDALVDALLKHGKRTFTQIKAVLGIGGIAKFNFEDPKRTELKGDATGAQLSRKDCFGPAWFGFSLRQQDAIVRQLLRQESESVLLRRLQRWCGLDERQALAVANAGLPEGFGSLSAQALARIIPELQRDVVRYSDAVRAAGFEHHSQLDAAASGEILPELPYYGEALTRHVGFGSGKLDDPDELRYGRIANPTVHIGLNQVRRVVNALIAHYGHPSQVIVEVARELKQGAEQRKKEHERQALNERRNTRFRSLIAETLQMSAERVKRRDIEKMILWEELGADPADRRCPYSGVQIGIHLLLGDEVEIEHILPFSQTLDDSLNNRTVALRRANRVKGNRSPWDAFGRQPIDGFDYPAMLERAQRMPRQKRYRFDPDGYEKWLNGSDDGGGRDFLARALNDTRYLSKVAREYLSLICPQGTRVIPGRMTAMLRRQFGLNGVLGLNGEKNRDDHRHHAVDACVIAVTDQGLLQRFAQASASAREGMLDRLVENMPLPWPTYAEHVRRAVQHIWVSHKPDHGHQGALHNETAYGLRGDGRVVSHKQVDGVRTRIDEKLAVIEFSSAKAAQRHGLLADGSPRPYKGYKGDSNFCIEIVRNAKGRWEGEVVSTFDAYQAERRHGPARLRDPRYALSGRPLVMRLMIDDSVRLVVDDRLRTMRVATISGNGQVFMADVHEANVDARNRDKSCAFGYISKMAGSFQSAQARRVTISEIGELRDPGFAG